MKKLLVFAVVAMLTLSLTACQKTVSGLDVCTFPEESDEIKCQVYSGGTEKEYVINADVIEWYYNLKLNARDQPEDVDGAEAYSFEVNSEMVITYQSRGSDEAYIIRNGNWYKVTNPSTPPLDIE